MRLSLGTQMPSAYAEFGWNADAFGIRRISTESVWLRRPRLEFVVFIVRGLRHDSIRSKVRIRWGHSEYATTPFHQGCIQRTAGGYSCVYL